MNSAQVALNKKLKLERWLYNAVRSIFLDIGSKSSVPFFDPSQYEMLIEDALQEHYIKVFNVFGRDYRDRHNIELNEIQEELLFNEIGAEFDKRADKQARIITRTNIKQLDKSRAVARAQAEMFQTVPYSRLLVDLYTASILRRVSSISIYETQWCAEFCKAFEVSYLISERGIEAKAKKKTTKRWDAVGDSKMRDWHGAADSQITSIGKPFRVNGELLMFPGDTSLGATASNIINCRCSVEYGISFDALSALDPFEEEDVPKAPVTDERVTTVGRRLEKSIADARRQGDDALLAELNKLKAEYDDLLKRHLSGETIQTSRFASIGKRRTDLMKGRTPVVKPVVKPPPAPTPVVPKFKPPEFVPPVTGKLSLDDALARAKDEIDELINTHGLHKMTSKLISDRVKELNNVRRNTIFPEYKPNIYKSPRANAHHMATEIKDPFGSSTHQSAAKTIRQVTESLFDEGLLHESLRQRAHESIKFILDSPSFRAHAQKTLNEIVLSTMPNKRTIAHELGHHIEFRNPEIQLRVRAWRYDRIQKAKARGERPVKMFGDREDMWKDDFIHPYVGKDYSSGDTEVLSMGLEAFFDDLALVDIMHKDRKHLDLIWSILRGY